MRLTPLAFRGGAAYSRYGAMGDPGLDHYLAGLDTALQQLLAQVEGTQIELTKVRETLQQQGRSKDYHRHNDTSTTTSSSANLHNNINQAEGTKVTSASDGSPSSAKDKREEKEREKEEGHGKKVQVSRSPDAVHSIILTDNGTDLPKTPIQRRRTEEDRKKQDQRGSLADCKSLIISLPSRRRMVDGLEETMEVEVMIPYKKHGLVSVYFQVPFSYSIDNLKHWLFRKVSIVKGSPEDFCLSINKEKLFVEFTKLADVPSVQQALKNKEPICLELERKDAAFKRRRKTALRQGKKKGNVKEEKTRTSYYLDKMKGIKGHRDKKDRKQKKGPKKKERTHHSHHNSKTSSSSSINTEAHVNGGSLISSVTLKQKTLEIEMRERALELQETDLKEKKRKLKEREDVLLARERHLKGATEGQHLNDVDINEHVEKGKQKERERRKAKPKGKESRKTDDEYATNKITRTAKAQGKGKKKGKRKDKDKEKENKHEQDNQKLTGSCKEKEMLTEEETREREKDVQGSEEKPEANGREGALKPAKAEEDATSHEHRKEGEMKGENGKEAENEDACAPLAASHEASSKRQSRSTSREMLGSCEGELTVGRSEEIQNAVDALADNEIPSSSSTDGRTHEGGEDAQNDEVEDLKRRLQETVIGKDRLEYLNSIDLKLVHRMQKIVKLWLVQRRWKITILAYRSSELSTQLQRRALALKEIVESEMVYSENLKTLVEVFYLPLRLTDILSTQDLQAIFSNIEEILSVSETFARDVQARFEEWPAVQSFGDIFIQYMKLFMEVYSVYIGNFEVSCEIVQGHVKAPEKSAFVKFIQENETTHFTRLKGLDLQSFLIMPVQRLPRYEILLRELVKQTPNVHSDYTTLTRALDRIQMVNKFVNQEKEKTDRVKVKTERRATPKQESTMRARFTSAASFNDPSTFHKRSRSLVQRFPTQFPLRRGSAIASLASTSSALSSVVAYSSPDISQSNNHIPISQPPSSPVNSRAPIISPKTAAHLGYGELRLELKQGRNIFSSDHTPPDAYTVLELGDQSMRSKVAKRTSNPLWDEQFLFTIKNFKNELKLACFDAKKLPPHKIGELNLTYTDIISCKSTEPRWLTLKVPIVAPFTTEASGPTPTTMPVPTTSITSEKKTKEFLPEIQIALLFAKNGIAERSSGINK